MTKKALREALDQTAAGQFDAAIATLRPIDRAFVRTKLKHLMTHGPLADRPAARTLLSIWAPHDTQLERGAPSAEIDEPESQLAPPVLVPAPPPLSVELHAPEPFLQWATAPAAPLHIDALHVAELWGLVGLGSLGNSRRSGAPAIDVQGSTGPARFAHALGLDRVLNGDEPSAATEPARTVPLRQVRKAAEILPAAKQLASLIVRDDKAMRAALEYVFIELLRNVVQHSKDPLGGVVGAQLNNQGPHKTRPVFQIAVADGGIGIPESLARMHKVADVREALERALWPHISGTFPPGLTGSGENAGLGLFFIAELAKLTVGRMMIATRMLTERAEHAAERVGPYFLEPFGVGFPGTLVAFELPADSVADFGKLTAIVQERAKERTPARAVTRWIRFEPAENANVVIRVADLAEDTARAAEIVKTRVRPAVIEGQSVAFDFSGIEICTQSFLHALLYETVRLAWATRTVLHAENAGPAVRSGIEFLERYALGG